MGERGHIKEQINLSRKLLSMNLKRVMLGSVCLFAGIPLFVVYIKLFASESYMLPGGTAAFLLVEALSAVFFFLGYLSAQSKDKRLGNLVTKSFWMYFLLLSMAIVYSDRMNNAGFVYYSIMLCAFAVGPLFSWTERIYYTVIQAIFVIVMVSMYGASPKEVFDLILINLGRAGLAAAIYGNVVSRLKTGEKLRAVRENDARDPLTGFMNRKTLENAVDLVWEDSKQKRKRMSMLIVDIDNFKEYNDNFGISEGDKCISRIGEIVGRIAGRDTEIISRLTGGRFVVFINGSDRQEPLLLAEKIRNNVERSKIPLEHNTLRGRYITVSIGVSSMEPGLTTTFPELYDEADSALYSAKEYGRNLIVFDEHVYGGRQNRAGSVG